MTILMIDTVHPLFREMVEARGFRCVDGSAWERERVLRELPRYAGIVIRSRMPVDRAFIDAAPSLQFIARAGAGMENIDKAHAESKGIRCLNAPEGNRNAVAEHALGMLLALLNHLLRADAEVRQGIWRREANRGAELDGRTVGIIGFGNTGSAFARKLAGFDVRIMAYDKYVPVDTKRFPGVEPAPMDVLFETSDIVSLHLPLTPETDRLVDTAFLNRFSKAVILVNTARGRIVDTDALADALRTGRVAGACLDVLDAEDTSFENPALASAGFRYLRTSDRVVFTPHIAGWTNESDVKIARVLAEKVIAAGHPDPGTP